VIIQWVLAGGVVAVVAARPQSWSSATLALVLASGAAALEGGGSIVPALQAVWPMVAFLVVAIGAATLAVRLGAVERVAMRLAGAARGRAWALFVIACALSALLTALVSLDGAVVLMVPVVVELARRFGAPLRPLLLGVVAVANAFSLAVPEGNPTNLVILDRLGLPPSEAAARLLVPGIVAALLCALAVAWRDRRALSARYSTCAVTDVARPDLNGAVLAAGRTGVQVVALLVALLPLATRTLGAVSGLPGLMLVGLATAGLAALANNLPASSIVAAGLAPGPGVFAALAGLSVGALATPHGSVATLIASDIAGARAHAGTLTVAAIFSTIVATALVWANVV
jgi:Na+/H+ antiporter NhaD/arsenite permease-like protein